MTYLQVLFTRHTLMTRNGLITFLLKHRRAQKTEQREKTKDGKNSTIHSCCIYECDDLTSDRDSVRAAVCRFFTRTHAHKRNRDENEERTNNINVNKLCKHVVKPSRPRTKTNRKKEIKKHLRHRHAFDLRRAEKKHAGNT